MTLRDYYVANGIDVNAVWLEGSDAPGPDGTSIGWDAHGLSSGLERAVIDPALIKVVPGYTAQNLSLADKWRISLRYMDAQMPAAPLPILTPSAIVAAGTNEWQTIQYDVVNAAGETRAMLAELERAQAAQTAIEEAARASMTIPSAAGSSTSGVGIASLASTSSLAPMTGGMGSADDATRARVLAFAGPSGTDPGDWGRVPSALGVSESEMARLGIGPSSGGGTATPSYVATTVTSGGGGIGSLAPLLLLAAGVYFATKGK